MSEPRVYKTSPILLVFIAVLFVFFLGILLFVFGSTSLGFTIPLLALSFFLLGSAFIMLASKTLVSDDEITIQGLLGVKSLKWMEIGRVSGWGYAMKLHSRDEDVTLSVSPRLPGYEDIIEIVGAKRPDLFSPLEFSEMRRGLSVYLVMFLITLALLGISVAFIIATLNSPEASLAAYMPLLAFVGVVVFFFATTFSVPRLLLLDGRTMNLKYLFSDKSIHADEVRLVQFSYSQSRNGKHYFIALHLTSGKNIRLSGLGLSLPIAYLVLKNWHRGSVHG